MSVFAGLLLIGATSCVDEWSDHYASNVNGNGTLWQSISDDASLSNFKQLLEATGYDAALNGNQVFTIFAPTNDELTAEKTAALIAQYNKEKNGYVDENGNKVAPVKDSKNSVIKEFIQNHISLYNYSVSNAMKDTTISMMNGKNVTFTKNGFAGSEYVKSNVLTGNGVLFSIGNVAKYNPNVYEYLGKDEQLDSVYKYLSKYNIEEFDPKRSVPGEIKDGKTHYLDSVTVTQNDILENKLYALLENEDSTYWMLAPTNEVWKELYEKTSKYFVYDKKVSKAERDSLTFHHPRLAILQGTTFTKTFNKSVFQKMSSTEEDSLMSTNAASYLSRKYMWGSYDKKYYQFTNPFGKGGVLDGAEVIDCSNGKILKASTWNVKPEETYLREIVMDFTSSATVDSLNLKTTSNKSGDTSGKVVRVSSDNPYYHKVHNDAYLELTAISASNMSKNLFDIRNVLSNVPYDVYIVTVPAEADNKVPTDLQKLPTIFRVSFQCNNEDGNAYYINTADGKLQYQVYKNNEIGQGPTTNNTQSKILTQLETKPGVLDTLFVGTYTFPTSSYGLDEAQVKMLIDSRVSSSSKTHNRILRLDCIIFKPRKDN
ncbi:MAG: fasciclin domain-containing protein [Prevotella sp.]|nr:fasciclin domain-containing protein [Candidatus Prevotella equi]